MSGQLDQVKYFFPPNEFWDFAIAIGGMDLYNKNTINPFLIIFPFAATIDVYVPEVGVYNCQAFVYNFTIYVCLLYIPLYV